MTLALDAIDAFYGRVQVLDALSLHIAPGEVLALMGRNGAGKSTALKAIMGLVAIRAGSIRIDGMRLDRLRAHHIPRHGIGYVPQGRRLFSELTVAENLEIGLVPGRSGPASRARALARFPRLGARLSQRAGTLSGGEQQMLAIARALCLEPRVLLLDEPSEGLQPSMAALVGDTVRDLRQSGVAVLLVEQRVETALALADRIAFLDRGTCAETHQADALGPQSPQFRRFVGV